MMMIVWYSMMMIVFFYYYLRLVSRNPYTFCTLLGFHARLAKIDFEKIASKVFLPRLPPKKKQKIMDIPFAMM